MHTLLVNKSVKWGDIPSELCLKNVKNTRKKENVHPFGKSYHLSVHFGQIAPIIAKFSKGLILKNIKCTLQWRQFLAFLPSKRHNIIEQLIFFGVRGQILYTTLALLFYHKNRSKITLLSSLLTIFQENSLKWGDILVLKTLKLDIYTRVSLIKKWPVFVKIKILPCPYSLKNQ